MIFASVDGSTIGLSVGFLISSALGLANLLRGLKQDNDSNVQKAIDLALRGNKELVENLRSDVSRYREETHECQSRCEELNTENEKLHGKIETLEDRVDTMERQKSRIEAENIALLRRLGELP